MEEVAKGSEITKVQNFKDFRSIVQGNSKCGKRDQEDSPDRRQK